MSTTGITNAPGPRRAGRPRVLVVEDDEDTRELIALALGGEGFVIETARGSEEAMRLLRARAYDLVVTDYDMPGRTGAELLHDAHRAGLIDRRDALIVTAHPEPVGVEGLSLVRKPVDLGRLVTILRAILERQSGAVPTAASASPDPVVYLPDPPRPHAIVMPAHAGARSYLLAIDDTES